MVSGKELKKLKFCNEFKDCGEDLKPQATGANVGQCVFINPNGIIQNTFDA
jgi:hypothetical protein